MRVLIVSNFYPPRVLGGYELGCAQVAGELRRRGHRVRVLTSNYSVTLDTDDLAGRLQLEPIYMWDLIRWMPESSRRQLLYNGRLSNSVNTEIFLSEIQTFGPDIIYFWNVIGVGGLALVAAAELLEAPWVMHLMDNVPVTLCSSEAGPVREFAALWSKLLTRGRYVSLSRQLIAEISDGGIDLDPVHYVPNWVITQDYMRDRFADPNLEAGGLWSTADRGRRPLKAVFSGVVSPPKGAHIVLDIAEELDRRGVEVEVTLLGRHEIEGFDAEIHRRGLQHSVKAPGAVPRAAVLDALGHADVLLFPTWEREPFGFAIIEAAAAGCPPIFTDRCGAGEYLVDGVHGLKAPRDARRFADVVERIWVGEISLEPIGRAAQTYVRRDLDIRVMGSAIEAILDDARREYRVSPDKLARIRRLSSYVEQILIPTACY